MDIELNRTGCIFWDKEKQETVIDPQNIMYNCFCVDLHAKQDACESKLIYGAYDLNSDYINNTDEHLKWGISNWIYIPYKYFPDEFKARLLLLEITPPTDE